MSESQLPPVVLVTGTDTDVGKTVVTAAVVATALAAGLRVTAYKPTQTGWHRASPATWPRSNGSRGVATVEGVRLRAPMAPRPAARLEGAGLPTLEDHVARVAALAVCHDLVVVEGAGGLLVELTDAGETLADLASALPDSGVLVVARSALGTLNHTMLTREALSHRGIRQLGIVIGSWPDDAGRHRADEPRRVRGRCPRDCSARSRGAPRPEPVRRSATTRPRWLPGLAQRLGTP